MNRLLTGLLIILLQSMLGACSTQPLSVQEKPLADDSVGEAMSRAAIVTTGTPRLDPAKPSRISWLGKLDVMGQHQTLSQEELSQHLTTVINQQVMVKGYPLASESGDFRLQGVLVLADQQDERSVLRASGGMDPGLMGSDQSPGKGTLVLELKQGRVTRWKGSVQIYIAAQFDQAVALRRIEVAVAQLLTTWP